MLRNNADAPPMLIFRAWVTREAIGNNKKTGIARGQEDGMDEDTAMWKEGVRVRSFMEAQKVKKSLIWKVI